MEFKIGDNVTVQGYGMKVFEVQRFLETSVYLFGAEEKAIIYTVKNKETGWNIKVFGDQMTLYKGKKKTVEEDIAFNRIVDISLDKYNDEMALYGMFGDDKYKENADDVLAELKKLVDERNEVK